MRTETLPTILIDSREQQPLAITGFPVEVCGLPVGDYGLRGFSDWQNPRFAVERKSIPDLIGSLTSGRPRFMREIELLRRFGFAAILIEGTRDMIETHTYRGLATPQSILASLDAIQVRAGIHIVWAGDADGAARRLEGLVCQFVKGIQKDAQRLVAAGEGYIKS